MLHLKTDAGDLLIASGSVLMLLPDENGEGRAMVFAEISPDGLPLAMTTDEITEAVMNAEGWDVETIDEYQIDETDLGELFEKRPLS